MASNEESHSKKRAAARQISKDDDQDSGGEDEPMQGATFRRASEEVLAERRIVKVRRSAAPSSTPNPFASIKLVPPLAAARIPEDSVSLQKGTVSKPTVREPDVNEFLSYSEGVQNSGPFTCQEGHAAKAPKEDIIQVEPSILLPAVEVSETVPASSITADTDAALVGVNSQELTREAKIGEATKEFKESGSVGEKEGTDEYKGPEKKVKEDESESLGPTGGSSGTFQQRSGTKNAFAGSFGTGFASSPFVCSTTSQLSAGFASFGGCFRSSSQPFQSSSSFGQSSPGANSSSPVTVPSLSSVFGKSNGSHLLGSAAAAASAPTPALFSLQEVAFETGEEKEKAAFTADAGLFEFFEGGWKERGRGELKVNVSEEDKRARLVMRSKGNYRLLLNASLFPEMKLTKMDNRGVSFVCVNSAAEGKTGAATYAIKFKDAVIAAEFSTIVQLHKGNVVSSDPRTPESSPKAVGTPVKTANTSKFRVYQRRFLCVDRALFMWYPEIKHRWENTALGGIVYT
ncbi:hypothetical protein R1sor_008985 [Riccia sorocarpa]|uniref:RanBD1 domain-containing protein n=1 Tax=Riccia sorocarpa TaxID=122646 RepID=A0ABD3H8H9_9MARC